MMMVLRMVVVKYVTNGQKKDNQIIIVHQPMEYHPLETKDWNKQGRKIYLFIISDDWVDVGLSFGKW